MTTPTPPPAAPATTAMVIADLKCEAELQRVFGVQHTYNLICSAITHLTALSQRCAALEEDGKLDKLALSSSIRACEAVEKSDKQVRSYLKALGVNLTELFKKWDGRAPEELTEEICFLATCAECDAQTNEEVKAYLLANGYTQERLDAGLARIRKTIDEAIAKSAARPSVAARGHKEGV